MNVITGLGGGGAEMMLLKLSTELTKSGHKVSVVSLGSKGVIGARLEAIGVEVYELKLSFLSLPFSFFRLMKLVKTWRPALVQTWMYHADLFAGLAGFVCRVPVVWNIRQSNLDAQHSKPLTRLIARINGILSYFIPQKIICCAQKAAEVHQSIGYNSRKFTIIYNGFDTSIFKPEPSQKSVVREELLLPTDARVVGLVARFDPQKDHRTFLQAAQLVVNKIPNTFFVMCGSGISPKNQQLNSWLQEFQLSKHIFMLEYQNNIAFLNQAFDVSVSSSSYGEGFPNSIGESMACGIPCVVTDVGDSSSVVGDSGLTVPTKNAEELANAIMTILDLPRAQLTELKSKARDRIVKNYSIASIAKEYENLYLNLI